MRTDSRQATRLLCVAMGHPLADDNGPGTEENPFKTIARAAEQAEPGDTVRVHAGIYREHVAPRRGGEPDRPITYAAADGEPVIIKGSEVWTPDWRTVPNAPAVLEGDLDPALFGEFNPYRTRAKALPGVLTLGQVFCDGEPLTEVDDPDTLQALPGTWMATQNGDVLRVHFPAGRNPENAMIEISVRDRIFAPRRRGLGYITVRGFVFEHCANQSANSFWEETGTQMGAVSARAGHHWIIENNVIRRAKSIGLDCGSEGGRDSAEGPDLTSQQVGYHIIRHNVICDNGECGITGWKQTGTQILHNRIERSNALGFGAVEEAGIKCHLFYDGLIEGNLLRDNDAHGIWLDNVWYGTRVTRNVCLNNAFSGIFIELGTGACLVDNNIVAGTRQGDGIYTHDASGVIIAHNLLFANAHFGINVRLVSERETFMEDGSVGMTGAADQKIFNNVSIDNYRGHLALPLPSERCEGNLSNHNLFVNGTQWHWEGASPAQFTLGTNDGRISPQTLQAAYQAALATLPEPPETPTSAAEWAKNPALDLPMWRLLTGWDTQSTVIEAVRGEVRNGALEKGSIALSVQSVWLHFRSAALFSQSECPPVAGITHDFFGTTNAPGTMRPGPFQNLPEAEARIVLWPVQMKGDTQR